MRRPARVLFRHQTTMDALAGMADVDPRAEPSGFVFHMSRCGSTLVAQMLAADPEHVVVSEAGPIDAVLRAHLRDARVTDDQRIAWFRGLLGSYGAAHRGTARRLFVKFDSWSILELPLIHRAFPHVPWIFLYRDPTEVLVSHTTERGSQMLPGVLQPELFGLDWPSAAALSLDEYATQVLATVLDAAVQHRELGLCRLVDYTQLPAVVWDELCAHFDVPCTDADIARMREVAQVHAKRPYEQFADDRESKRSAAGEVLRTLAAQRLDPWYERLETHRIEAHDAPGRSR
jgi:hypothetical protein